MRAFYFFGVVSEKSQTNNKLKLMFYYLEQPNQNKVDILKLNIKCD